MATIDTSFVITRDNGTSVTLPYPQEYTPDLYDVDAPTSGRNASGTMMRDRVARKHKFNCRWAALSHAQVTFMLQAAQDESFNLTAVDIFDGTRKTFRVYAGDRSAKVYWYPSSNTDTWVYESLSMNFIEM